MKFSVLVVMYGLCFFFFSCFPTETTNGDEKFDINVEGNLMKIHSSRELVVKIFDVGFNPSAPQVFKDNPSYPQIFKDSLNVSANVHTKIILPTQGNFNLFLYNATKDSALYLDSLQISPQTKKEFKNLKLLATGKVKVQFLNTFPFATVYIPGSPFNAPIDKEGRAEFTSVPKANLKLIGEEVNIGLEEIATFVDTVQVEVIENLETLVEF